MAAVTVSMCLCRGVPFGELLPPARAAGWDLETLMRMTGCGAPAYGAPAIDAGQDAGGAAGVDASSAAMYGAPPAE